MSGVKVDFIGQLIIDTRITLTEDAEASSKQLVARKDGQKILQISGKSLPIATKVAF